MQLKKEVMKMDEAQNGRQRICNVSHATGEILLEKISGIWSTKKPTTFWWLKHNMNCLKPREMSQKQLEKTRKLVFPKVFAHELPSGDFFSPEQT